MERSTGKKPDIMTPSITKTDITKLGIIFDLDDTLCDWQAAQQSAELAINDFLLSHEVDHGLFWQHFHHINEDLYTDFVNGKLKKHEYRVHRFAAPLTQQYPHKHHLASQINDLFMQTALQSIHAVAGVQQVLEKALNHHYQIGILTNGASDSQREKIRRLGLEPYIHAICISEEVGIGKPNPQAFYNACARLNCQPEHCIMVGDSWLNDIAPAQALGMGTYWVATRSPQIQVSEGILTGSLSALSPLINARKWW